MKKKVVSLVVLFVILFSNVAFAVTKEQLEVGYINTFNSLNDEDTKITETKSYDDKVEFLLNGTIDGQEVSFEEEANESGVIEQNIQNDSMTPNNNVFAQPTIPQQNVQPSVAQQNPSMFTTLNLNDLNNNQ